MPETYTHHDGRTFYVIPAPFGTSINKCTGCALHAKKYTEPCGDALQVCAGWLNGTHADKILTTELP